MYKTLTTFLDLINKVFYEFLLKFCSHIYRCLKKYQLDIINITIMGYKEKLKKCENHSREEKGKQQQYGRVHHKNLSENEKQKLVEHRKNIIK